jgi:histidinol-phosphate/aromatic aminotransferase/cobyric acid decarboxylase-like protein
MRTLSKFGLAGVRLGYMIGPQAWVAEVDKVRPPYNISVLNTECALFALAHAEVIAALSENGGQTTYALRQRLVVTQQARPEARDAEFERLNARVRTLEQIITDRDWRLRRDIDGLG